MFNKKNMEKIRQLIESNGGKTYIVGGTVRDHLLSVVSKDIDLLITKMSQQDLVYLLEKLGKVDLVGESFGVFKFKAFGSDEVIDIALPRTEKKIGDGHKGFEVVANEHISLDDDLSRRDFTINAMAVDSSGNTYDPYGGMYDCAKKLIKMVNPNAFADDPLRMLRAVQFSARFGFSIERKTAFEILKNRKRINEITGERVIIEFEKIVNKGKPKVAARQLIKTGLYEILFPGFDIKNMLLMSKVKTVAEFLYELTGEDDQAAYFMKLNFKVSNDISQELRALAMLKRALRYTDDVSQRLMIFDAINISPVVINTKLFVSLQSDLKKFQKGKYPKTIKEIRYDGNDFIRHGYYGVEIGKMQRYTLSGILAGEVLNNEGALSDYVPHKVKQ